MKCRKFTLQDQLDFAELSGDYNPLHIDEVAARRLMFGSVVVHGIHSLLWGIDTWLHGQSEAVELCSIKANFSKPIRINEDVHYSLKSESENYVEIELLVKGLVATKLSFSWKPSHDDEHGRGYLVQFPPKAECKAVLISDAQKASGELTLHYDAKAFPSLFQNLPKQFSGLQVAQFLASTRLVGMECPGLHSVYSLLDLNFDKNPNETDQLDYKMSLLDQKYGLARMSVTSSRMTGNLTTFFRSPPQDQVSFKDLREKVTEGEFADQKALIVGGSRGLGEVTAKLLAMGGADVKITYHKGADEAGQVVDEINDGGGSAKSFSFDVLNEKSDILNGLGNDWVPTHVYYFPTPFIGSGTKGRFSPALFQKFCNYYVLGFEKIIKQLGPLGLKAVFYPSSVYASEPPSNMGEYAAAKMAGEGVCSFLRKTQKQIEIYAPRLPKMATDQTAGFMVAGNQDPVTIMSEYLRNLKGLLESR